MKEPTSLKVCICQQKDNNLQQQEGPLNKYTYEDVC